MKRIKLIIPLFALCLLVLASCKKSETPTKQITKESVAGFVQKGPYLNGSFVTMAELNESFVPTGLVFNSEILSHTGAFNIKHVTLSSPYVELRGQGFYFNEVSGQASVAQLTLYALANTNNATDINVNILSTLEKRRVEYLVEQGSSFDDAKKQAQFEVLKIFGFNSDQTFLSESLNITSNTEGDAMLLAMSVILQSYRSVGELSELIANIGNDLYEDGTLDNESLGSQLINGSLYLNLAQIRANVENRYRELGQEVTVPDFEKYVTQFINTTAYQITSKIEYPTTGAYGNNLLNSSVTNVSVGTYSLKTILPKGVGFKVKVKGSTDNMWFFSPNIAQVNNWIYTEYDTQEFHRFFTATKDGELDLSIRLEPGTLSLEVYEGNQSAPTFTKNITVN